MGFEAYSFSTPFAFSHPSTSSGLENILKVFESHPQGAQAPCLVTHSKIRFRGFCSWVPNGIRTHAAAFTEPSANHYTIGTIFYSYT